MKNKYFIAVTVTQILTAIISGFVVYYTVVASIGVGMNYINPNDIPRSAQVLITTLNQGFYVGVVVFLIQIIGLVIAIRFRNKTMSPNKRLWRQPSK